MSRDKRQFGYIRKMPSKRYSACYTNTAGKRVFAPGTFKYKVDAEAWLVDRRREIEVGRYNPDAFVRRPKILFSDYATDWLTNRQVNGRPIKLRTREHYQALLDGHLLPAFGAKVVASIEPKDVWSWYNSTLVDKPTMRSHAYGLLRSIMASAERDDIIAANPCRVVGAGSAKRAKVITPATVQELKIITDAMPERLQLMVLFASWCALRFGETIELRRHDIDLNAEVIRIRRQAVRVKQDGRLVFVVTTPKSDAGSRDVDIPSNIIPAIEHHLEKFTGSGGDALLFSNKSGEHLQPSTLSRHFYKARNQAGRPDLRWHDLRHTGGTMAAVTGATLAELMQRLGHSTPAAAMRYQHATQTRGREIAALLAKLADT
jgi:integrase